MRIRSFAIPLLAILPLLGSACAKGGKDTKDTVAVVNGTSISRKDFDLMLNTFIKRMNLPPQTGDSIDPRIGQMVMERLIGNELLYQEALRGGFRPDKSKVEEAVKGFAAGYPTPEDFQSELSALGVSDKKLREDVSHQIAIETYIEKGIPLPPPTDEEIRAFYDKNISHLRQPEQVRASHILIRVAEGASAADKEKARAKAGDLAAKARKGADFAELAKANSEDPGSAASGGDLGSFPRGRMVKPFEDKAFSLKVGEVSDPVLTDFGYHVIKVASHQKEGLPEFQSVRNTLVDMVKQMKSQEAVGRKVEELRAKAEIKTLMEFPPAKAPPPSGQ